MAKIKIIAVPPGEAPLWVRQEWVGVILVVAENLPSDAIEMGVFGGKPINPGGYPVETMVAIQELKKKSSFAAALWWEKNISPFALPWLAFQREVCVYEP